MTFDSEVLDLEHTLIEVINDINARGHAVESGKVGPITIDVTTTKTELEASKDAFVAASDAYKTAAIAWFNALP